MIMNLFDILRCLIIDVDDRRYEWGEILVPRQRKYLFLIVFPSQ